MLDSSAAIEWLLKTPKGLLVDQRIVSTASTIHAPELIDLEIVNVLGRMVSTGHLLRERAARAFIGMRIAPWTRYRHTPYLDRIWSLRPNLAAYDAACVCLAEHLKAPLVTCDGHMARSSGHSAVIELF